MAKGDICELSSNEISTFKELKNKITEEFGPNVDDKRIVRILRARDFDIVQAHTMLKKDLEWRKQYSTDSIVFNYTATELYLKYYAMSFIGFDKEGSALLVINAAKADLKGFLKSSKKEDIIRYAIYIFELCDQKMQEHSKQAGMDSWTLIGDMDTFSYYQFASKLIIETAIEFCLLFDAHYPEKLKSVYIINSSGAVQALYSIIKPFIASKTHQKIKFYGKDGWKEELLENIDPDVLPARWGGERTDPDGNPLCTTIISPGGPVPERYYMKNTRKSLKNQAGVRSHVVKRRSKLEVPLYVQRKGCFIEWEFETEDHDIGFGLFYKDFDATEDDEMVAMIPIQRFDSYLLSETGKLKCEKPGIYILTLDNSYSRLRSKNVYYKVAVIKPEEKNKIDLSK